MIELSKDQLLQLLQEDIAEKAAEIERLFTDAVCVTICVRNVAHERRNLIVTNDPLVDEKVVRAEFSETVTQDY